MKFSHQKLLKAISHLRILLQIIFFIALVAPWLPHPDFLGEHLILPVILAGVLFCGFVCPLGSVQEWLFILGRKMHLPAFKTPLFIQRYVQFIRYVLAVLSFTGISFLVLNLRYYFHQNVILGMLNLASSILLALFFLASLFFPRPFCNYFCLKGAIDGALSMLRFISIQRNKSRCTACHRCTQACPMHIEVEKANFLRHPNCINCLQCLKACPQTCLHYDIVRPSLRFFKSRNPPDHDGREKFDR